MKSTHLSHALLAITSDSSVRALAASCGISPSTLSKSISEGRRLDEPTLRKLAASPKGLQILVAHLRDEIERAGRLQTEVRIEADDVTIDDDLRLLAEESQRDEGLAAILHEIAGLARRVRRNEGYVQPVDFIAPRAAEDPAAPAAERSGEEPVGPV